MKLETHRPGADGLALYLDAYPTHIRIELCMSCTTKLHRLAGGARLTHPFRGRRRRTRPCFQIGGDGAVDRDERQRWEAVL